MPASIFAGGGASEASYVFHQCFHADADNLKETVASCLNSNTNKMVCHLRHYNNLVPKFPHVIYIRFEQGDRGCTLDGEVGRTVFL